MPKRTGVSKNKLEQGIPGGSLYRGEKCVKIACLWNLKGSLHCHQEHFCLFSMFTPSQWVLKHNDVRTMPSLLRESQIYHLKSIWGANYICKTSHRSHFLQIYSHIIHLISYCVSLPFNSGHLRFLLLSSCSILLESPTLHTLPNFHSLCRCVRRKCLQKYGHLKKRNCIMDPWVPSVSTPASWMLAHRDCTTQNTAAKRDSSSTKHCTNSPAFSLSTWME